MINKKYIGVIIVIAGFLLMSYNSFGQKRDIINVDSQKTISLVEFNQRVNRATELLQTKELSAISNTDHINIMMCLNTIFMVHVAHGFEERFSGAQYKKLEAVADGKSYSRNIVKIYPQYIPNRGMGFYFEKLKMEFYGTPHLYAIYKVVN